MRGVDAEGSKSDELTGALALWQIQRYTRAPLCAKLRTLYGRTRETAQHARRKCGRAFVENMLRLRLHLIRMVLVVALLVLFFGRISINPAYRLIALMIFAFGTLLRICSLVSRGRTPNSHLITTGPYNFLRHPRYVGTALAFLATGLVFRPIAPALAVVLLLILLHGWTALKEEHHLRVQFGAVYEAYHLSVPRFFPSLTKNLVHQDREHLYPVGKLVHDVGFLRALAASLLLLIGFIWLLWLN
jgi:protein-S-isoprenylcysteine O-methyltransferase Ste14